jgi:hypothetical protein
VHLETLVSESPAVRRVLKDFELGQIWISDPKIAPLDLEQRVRMKKQFRTNSIPLHVIVDPHTGKELLRFEYGPLIGDDDYVEFLEKGLAIYEKLHGDS